MKVFVNSRLKIINRKIKKLNRARDTLLFPKQSQIYIKDYDLSNGNKGAYVAFLTYDYVKTTIKRMWVKPDLLLYNADKTRGSFLFKFDISQDDILEVRRSPNKLEFYKLKKRHFGKFQLENISKKEAFKVISDKISYLNTYLNRNARIIPGNVRALVWERDQGRCVQCGSVRNVHFDHIIPYSKGGAAIAENIQILCQKCNLHKSSKIASKNG
jgi:hypothetical protein